MQDPNTVNNQNQGGGDPNANNTPGGNAGGGENTEMTMQQMLEGISQELGGTPSGRQNAPEMDDVQQGIVDKQFEQDVRFALEDMQREVKAKIPDATDTQAFKIGVAMMQGDTQAVIDAVDEARKREAEIDEKSQEQKNLHVEGGASGKNEDGKQAEGLAGAMQRINAQYAGK